MALFLQYFTHILYKDFVMVTLETSKVV